MSSYPPRTMRTLGELGIYVDQRGLIQALDRETNDLRERARLSAYKLAEWLVWNWWRLRWEPSRRPAAPELSWSQAHDLASIGGGWLWPNITIESDGSRVALIARPSEVVQTEPLYHTAKGVVILPAQIFEQSVDEFIGSVLDRLHTCSLGDTDIHSTWKDLIIEREDPELSLYRRLEAYLGYDPDEAPSELIGRLVTEGNSLGLQAVSEVVADNHQAVLNLRDAAQEVGFDFCPSDGMQKFEGDLRFGDDAQRISAPSHAKPPSQIPAWKVGVEAARALRERERLGESLIPNPRLAKLYGASEQVFSRWSIVGNLSFSLDTQDQATGRLVLRPRSRYGRRFDVARLLGDRLLTDYGERLHPATRVNTYRQKMQRAFAAELLCPLHSLLDFLDKDFSEERRQDAAERYKVSPLLVTTMLANNGYLNREELADPEVGAAYPEARAA